MRIGFGEDIHRTTNGKPLLLGGILIEEGPQLKGHSDADVLLHAITDAILGAAALGDIGTHFPDNDEKWLNMSSSYFLETAIKLAKDKGLKLINIDATIKAKKPKLAPYIGTIRSQIAGILAIEIDDVSIKAKSNDGLDAVGEGAAIAASAIVLMEETASNK
ncbi:MAG: 2-C-methyl-D-erythritol 2,4-cyclodiphosphate synthase [Dehalococcoidia bacterium]|nr:2-C-methyl-D-erythritol 2,4-cyclodiphosphate synthase [Dehalococcoidia bacterium]|tara:strand:+ start:1038 stop:1523 length:486 start_codon:yes stop_codon:yes gene_type:complete